MKTYWDLEEHERAALSDDDVKRYVDAELMLKGVLKVKPVALDDEPMFPEPNAKAFIVRSGSYDKVGVAFETIEQARAFIALRPKRIANEWMSSTTCEYLQDFKDMEVAEALIFTESAKNAVKADLQRAHAARATNEKRRTEYAEAVKAQDDALKGLWDDYYACREQDAKLRAVLDTFEDYKRTAGDARVALTFLAKVYPSDVIESASERFGRFARIVEGEPMPAEMASP